MTTDVFIAACVQLRSTTNIEDNWRKLEEHCLRAAASGASLIATPENSLFLGPQFHKVEIAESLNGPTVQRLQNLATRCSAHLLVGSIAQQRRLPDGSVDPQHCYNTSLLFDPTGKLLASYQKIHLFDVDVSGGLCIRESDTIAAGERIVVAETALGRIGLSICYDLRFPELYRKMVDRGVDLIAIPSAFTLTTGKDHWHPLLRARAIETQSYVLAPGQWGTHDSAGKRRSYGHSLIVDPWGVVQADRGEGEGICYAEIDLTYLRGVRRSIPVRDHRKV